MGLRRALRGKVLSQKTRHGVVSTIPILVSIPALYSIFCGSADFTRRQNRHVQDVIRGEVG